MDLLFPPASLKANTLANIIGRASTGLMGFLFVPVYLKYLGAESYGLVGFWATLVGIFAVLDLGICATLNREMARLSVDPGSKTKMANLLYTLERINWGFAIVIGATVMSLAGPIARHWVNARELPIPIVQDALRLIGLMLILQWPYTLYSNGLNGLQRQVAQNVIAVSMTALRNIGVLGVLAWVSPTITAFFIWQIGGYLVQLMLSRHVLWRRIPRPYDPPRFQLRVLLPIRRFALSMSGISLVVMILTQADRIVLSKMIPLDQFGYYSLAAAVSGGLGMLVAPIATAVYPRLAQLVASADHLKIEEFYHNCCQIAAVSVLPVTIVVCLFSEEILLLWTGNSETTARVHLLVRVLVIGTGLNGLMNIPYALQLAYGWTSLALWSNAISVVLLVPAMVVLVWQWGPIGAAVTWVILNSGYVLFNIQVMHRRLLPGQQWRWYWKDVIMPAVAAAGVCVVARLVIPKQLPNMGMIPILINIASSALLASAFSVPAVRKRMLAGIGSLRRLTIYD